MPPGINQSDAATSTLITASGTALALNRNRRFYRIQNLGTSVLYVYLGAGCVAGTTFSWTLKAGTATDDGLGGSDSSDVVVFTGPISIDGSNIRASVVEI